MGDMVSFVAVLHKKSCYNPILLFELLFSSGSLAVIIMKEDEQTLDGSSILGQVHWCRLIDRPIHLHVILGRLNRQPVQ
jgi:hypothetical protein